MTQQLLITTPVNSGLGTKAPNGGDLINANFTELYAQYNVTAAEKIAGITPTTLSYEPYDLRRYGAIGNGVTDDTAAINRWITVAQVSRIGFLYPLVYLTTGNHAVTAQFNMISRGGSEYLSASPQFRLSGNATNLFNWNGLANAGPSISGVLVNGVIFNGNGFSCSDCLVAIQGLAVSTFRDCGFHSVTGSATRLRQFWDSYFDNCMWRAINAAGTNGVVIIDSRYNSDNNQNVNNVTFNRCHNEKNIGPLYYSASDSNLFIFRYINSKFECGVTYTGTDSVFNLQAASTFICKANTFHNFNSVNGYISLFTLANVAPFNISDNDFSSIDASTNYLNASGACSGFFERNTQFGGATGIVTSTSTKACRFEYPTNSSFQSDILQSFNWSQKALNGFVGVSYIGEAGPQTLTTDAASLSTTKAVVTASTASVILLSIPMQPFIGTPGSLRVGVRCKSASGAGTLSLVVNTTTFTAQNAPSTTFGTIWFDVTNDFLSIMGNSGSDRFRLITSGSNAEAVTVDGFYFQQVPWHYSKTFTYDPASIATLVSTSTTTTVTGAALGDLVDVYAPYDLQGISATGYVSLANTVTVVLFNGTAGTLDLASGSWFVRVTKK